MFMSKIVCIAVIAPLLATTAAMGEESERDRQEQLCSGMEMNRYLANGTYVDCITDQYAIEVDFSGKWAEAIGQSLSYAAELNRIPGIILLCEEAEDPSLCLKHGYLIEQTVSYWKLGITVWQCGVEDTQLDQCRRVDISPGG